MLPLLTILVLSLSGPVAAGRKRTEIRIAPDTVSVLRNPLSGWVLYLGRTWDEDCWERFGYDAMAVPGQDRPVRVSDYATTCYVRTGWSSFEPREGEYAWNDPSSRLMRLLRSAEKRGLRLAFRIVVDGRDQGQNTPEYVFEAGAEGYPDPNAPGRISPYPDDPVFQQKYTKFIEAFAREFDDADRVDFIDAYGLGKWGEAHSMVYKDYANKARVFEWVTDLYARTFREVPLVINYHRLVGANNTSGWGEVAPDTRELLESAIRKGYSLRHDAFGMNGYYQEWEKHFAAEWNFRRPILMEGGWITGAHHRYWIDPSGAYREGHPEDVRRGEFEESKAARVNMMDLRIGHETSSWFACFDLVQRFVAEGGYRLYPDRIELPEEVAAEGEACIAHRWRNLGWGYCPTNIPQWNQKYKVAFALLDAEDRVQKIFVDTQTDLSTWLKGKPTTYRFDLTLKGVSVGAYTWAVGLVDTTQNNAVGLEMAVKRSLLTETGWAKVADLKVE